MVNHGVPRSLHDFEAGFFNDRVGEDFFGDVLHLLQGFVAGQAFDIQDEKFALADVFDGGVAQPRERMLDCLSLRIEYRALRHHPNVCFHGVSITLRRPERELAGKAQKIAIGIARAALGSRIARFLEGELFSF
jgi:hypothetical protein